MTDEVSQRPHSPTVRHVIEQFIAAMRADNEIDDLATDRLEKLLRMDAVPKVEEIYSTLFAPPLDGDT